MYALLYSLLPSYLSAAENFLEYSTCKKEKKINEKKTATTDLGNSKPIIKICIFYTGHLMCLYGESMYVRILHLCACYCHHHFIYHTRRIEHPLFFFFSLLLAFYQQIRWKYAKKIFAIKIPVAFIKVHTPLVYTALTACRLSS